MFTVFSSVSNINKIFIKYVLDTSVLGFRGKVLSEKLPISQGILNGRGYGPLSDEGCSGPGQRGLKQLEWTQLMTPPLTMGLSLNKPTVS